ncbi:MAG: ThiF family adenylyltransferase [Deltaproteobacteria bacterium]|nr:ThiF family adenylyltransferase [Deltaproteobacteria bacterium]
MKPDQQEKIRGLAAEKSADLADPAGRALRVLSDREARPIADACGCRLHDVYREALAAGIYPHRYIRNRDIIPPEAQLKLAESRVGVVGAGGLGGHVILLLARMGIGTLVVLDHDVFDESNLNRQALSSIDVMGRPKVDAAVSAVAAVNPGVEVIPHVAKLTPDNAGEILKGSHVAVDALDNVADRFVLEDCTKGLGIPLVHGALAGFEGQLMTIFPEDEGLILLYGSREPTLDRASSPEAVLGVPTITPAVVASLEAMEVVKILLNRGNIFRNKLVHVDLETSRLNEFLFKEE